MEEQSLSQINWSDDQLRHYIRKKMFQLYDGQTYKIGDLFTACRNDLEANGIKPPSIQKMYTLFYRVMGELINEGLLKGIKHGIYYISSDGVDDYESDDSQEDGQAGDELSENAETICIGEGDDTVYVYYYPGYKELAAYRNEKSFRCKIGMTTQDTKTRISKSRTEAPENCIVGLVIKTDHAPELEKILLSVMKLSGKNVTDAPGVEWVYSSPEEVVNIYRKICSVITPEVTQANGNMLGMR